MAKYLTCWKYFEESDGKQDIKHFLFATIVFFLTWNPYNGHYTYFESNHEPKSAYS